MDNFEGEERRPVAPGRKTRKRSKGVNEICHAPEPTNSSHETEAHTFVDENIPETVEESFVTHGSSPKEEIINVAMSEEVEWALGQKREAQAQEMQAKEIQKEKENKTQETQKEEAEANLKGSGSSDYSDDSHLNLNGVKTDAEKCEDLIEKERQRKLNEESARAEKLRLENLMRLVQEKIDKAKREKEKQAAENSKV